MARNLLRDRFGRLLVERRVRRELAERGTAPRAASRVEDRTDLARALAALPVRQREVTVYHYFLDLEVAEIARVLGSPEGTVKSVLFRARRSLGETLRMDDEMEVTDVAP
jgi:RNA polymerase sigma-70 factor, ECF subfamily